MRSALVRLLRKGTKKRFSMARLKSSRDYNISRSHPNISMEISDSTSEMELTTEPSNHPNLNHLSPLLETAQYLATGAPFHQSKPKNTTTTTNGAWPFEKDFSKFQVLFLNTVHPLSCQPQEKILDEMRS